MNKEKSILVISPYAGKHKSGLSAYTNIFIEEISLNFKVTLLTNYGNIDQGIFLKKWSFFSLISIWRELKNFDAIYIQYVPQMYSRKGGINFSFPFFFLLVRAFITKNIIIMFHELYYPFEWRIRSMIMYFCHQIQLYILCNVSRISFCSTNYFKKIVSKKNCKKDTFRLPVYSAFKEFFQENNNDKNIVNMAVIGGLHPSKKIEEISRFVLNHKFDHKVKLHFLGITNDQLEASSSINEFEFHGYLSDSEFSKKIQMMDFLIAYFIDGISTRRGTVMVALQHGIPVISTKSIKSDLILTDKPFIKCFNTDFNVFQEELKNYIKYYNKDNYSQRIIKEFYNEYFSRERVGEQVRTKLSEIF